MTWFANLRVRSKVLFAFIIFLILSLSVGIYMLAEMKKINDSYKEAIELTEDRVGHIFAIQEHFARVRLIMREMFYPDNTKVSLDAYYEELENELTIVKEELDGLRDAAASEMRSKIDEILSVFNDYQEGTKDVVARLRGAAVVSIHDADYRAELEWAREEVNRIASEYGVHLYDNIDGLPGMEISALKDLSITNGNEVRKSQTISIILVILATALVIAVALYLSNAISQPLIKATGLLEQVSDNITAAAGQLSSSAGSLANGNSEQAASIEETAATMNEASSMILQSSANTVRARELAEAAGKIIGDAVARCRELLNGMNELSKSSVEIGEIAATISSISMQTNILALNAAVEAARAGAAGNSFSVVAEEVRSLAQKSAQSAKDTEDIIDNNQNLTKAGVSNSKILNNTLVEVGESTQKLLRLLNEISTSSEEQAHGIRQINSALSQIEKTTQTNAAISEESAAAAQELKNQTESLLRAYDDIRALVFGK